MEQSDTRCITCSRVLDDRAPVLYVCHDSDGEWQLLCGGDEHAGDSSCIRIVHAGHLMERDPSLAALFDLPRGHAASRESTAASWSRYERDEDETVDDERMHPTDCSCCQAYGHRRPLLQRFQRTARQFFVRVRDPDRFDETERRVVENVKKYGFHLWHVSPSADDDGFSYTVGLFDSYHHPELVIFGQKVDWRNSMIDFIVDQIREGKRFETGVLYPDLIEGFHCRFDSISSVGSYRDFLGWDLWYYYTVKRLKERVPVFQFVWPDMQGVFPDNSAFDNGYRQPLLP